MAQAHSLAEGFSAENSLYRIGGIAGFIAAGFALIQIIIEIIGVGIWGIPVPTTVNGWFALLQSDRLLALTELTLFQIPVFVFLVPLFLAVNGALAQTNKYIALIATALGLMGIAVYLSSNTVLSMLSLSIQHANAITDAEKSMFLAAGQAMLAIYEGLGVDVGVALIMVSILIISAVMLQSSVFGRAPASFGIVAGALTLVYYAVAAFTPAAIFILEGAGSFLVIWAILVGRTLYRLGSGAVKQRIRATQAGILGG